MLKKAQESRVYQYSFLRYASRKSKEHYPKHPMHSHCSYYSSCSLSPIPVHPPSEPKPNPLLLKLYDFPMVISSSWKTGLMQHLPLPLIWTKYILPEIIFFQICDCMSKFPTSKQISWERRLCISNLNITPVYYKHNTAHRLISLFAESKEMQYFVVVVVCF